MVIVPLVKEEEEVGVQLVVVWLVMESTVNGVGTECTHSVS